MIRSTPLHVIKGSSGGQVIMDLAIELFLGHLPYLYRVSKRLSNSG